jgi:YHS domain-containing protein
MRSAVIVGMSKTAKIISWVSVVMATLVISSFVFQNQQKKNGAYNARNGVFVKGYDVVSYFSGTPLQGNESYLVKHDGVTFYFVNDVNKKKFEANPEKFIPAYGGWCAYSIGDNAEKVEVNPKTFKIIDGKNYLFYNKLLTNTLVLWNKDEESLLQKAQTNWLKVKDQ